MRNLSLRRSRYAFASLVVAGGLVAGLACTTGGPGPPNPGLVIAPITNDFGSRSIPGETSAATFTVKNNGPNPSGTLSVGIEGNNPGSFNVLADSCSGTTLPAGAGCKVDVTFKPLAPPGPKDAELLAKSTVPADGAPKANLTGMATETGQP